MSKEIQKKSTYDVFMLKKKNQSPRCPNQMCRGYYSQEI